MMVTKSSHSLASSERKPAIKVTKKAQLRRERKGKEEAGVIAIALAPWIVSAAPDKCHLLLLTDT